MSGPLDAAVTLGFFAVTGAAFAAAERARPARAVDGRAELAFDAFSVAWSMAVSGGVLFALPALLGPRAPSAPPARARAAAFLVLADLAKYAAHRAMHTRALWRTHRLHHSPRALYWLSGNRASAPMLALHFGPIALLAWMLDAPAWAVLANALLNALWNHFMHTNLALPARLSRALERVVVTPRYHHLHHADRADLRGLNCASVLTAWDRLFGTYADPDAYDPSSLRFGAGEQGHPGRARMLAGL